MSAPDGGKPKDPKTKAAEAAISAERAAARQRRAEAEVEYKQATDSLFFTKHFNKALDAIIQDELNTTGHRFLAWLERNSWGENALYAIGVDGKPLFQVDAAATLGVSESRISHVVSYYVARGIVRTEAKKLYLVISPKLGPPPEKLRESATFSQFLEEWKVANSSNFQELEVARSTVKRIRKVVLSDYKNWRASRPKAAASLLDIADQGPKTGKQAGVSPLEESNRRHRQAPARTANEEEKQSDFQPLAFLFAEVRRMQDAYPKSLFATPRVNPEDPGDQGLFNRVLKELGDTSEDNLVAFVVGISAKFKGWGAAGRKTREPGSATGPQSIGLLVNWAQDHARIAGRKAKGAAV
jgi:hypothetical protein